MHWATRDTGLLASPKWLKIRSGIKIERGRVGRNTKNQNWGSNKISKNTEKFSKIFLMVSYLFFHKLKEKLILKYIWLHMRVSCIYICTLHKVGTLVVDQFWPSYCQVQVTYHICIYISYFRLLSIIVGLYLESKFVQLYHKLHFFLPVFTEQYAIFYQINLIIW